MDYSLKNSKQFVTELISEFPEIKADILDEDHLGLISLQVGDFRNFTQRAIDHHHLDLVKRCFSFLDERIDLVDDEVQNSLFISFLGKINFGGNKLVEDLLPFKLAEIVAQLNEYDKSTEKNEQAKKFLDDL